MRHTKDVEFLWVRLPPSISGHLAEMEYVPISAIGLSEFESRSGYAGVSQQVEELLSKRRNSVISNITACTTKNIKEKNMKKRKQKMYKHNKYLTSVVDKEYT